MFDLNTFLKPYKNLGALEDVRTRDEKEKDYLFNEIVATADDVVWEEKEIEKWRLFPVRDQHRSGSCVAQSGAKMVGMLRYLEDKIFMVLSASDTYQRRTNKYIGDGQGMGSADYFSVLRNHGDTLEILMPSQMLTEKEINEVPREDYFELVGKAIGGISNYVSYEPKVCFEQIASTIQKTGKGVMVWFRFGSDEWWRKVPRMITNNLTMHHSVVATDTVFYKGKKALIIEDSAGPETGFEGGRRIITEDFFKERNSFAGYAINLKNLEEGKPKKPKYTFRNKLQFSPIYNVNKEVVILQNILKYEGLFPTNVESTGYYGAITAKNVLSFQRKYQVASPVELDSLEGKIVGPSTRAKLNELYSG